MIKINLATRKRSAGLDAGGDPTSGGDGLLARLRNIKLGGGGGTGSASASASLAISAMGGQMRSIVIAIGVSVAAYFFFNSQKQEEIQKATAEVTKEKAQTANLRSEYAKTSGYQAKKLQLEKDEKILRTKIDTIKKLTVDRDSPPKLMRELAEAAPKDLWFSSLELDEDKKLITLKGKSYAETSVTALTKLIASNALLAGSDIKESATEKDPSGIDVFSFTIEARRK